ncbi:lantibiotic dehydratase [Streptomyces violascens]|uniref:lantibiotic dehydratase n=1 Tax=Streptomyces violascens TaxID=67381 RepID=UPI003796A3EE
MSTGMRAGVEFETAGVALLRAAVLPTPAGHRDRVGACETGRTRRTDADDAAWLRSWLVRTAADTALLTAVSLASPSLAEDIGKVVAGAPSKTKRLRRIAVSLAKYQLRMTHRPTPFGLFAGVALAEFGPDASLEPGDTHQPSSRPDAGWLQGVLDLLHTLPGVLERTRLVANGLRTVRDSRLVLVDSYDSSGNKQLPHSVRFTSVVRCALEHAAEPIAWRDLVPRLTHQFPGAPDGAVEHCVTQLTRARLLLSDLVPPPDSPAPLSHILERLEGFRHPLVDALHIIRAGLSEVDSAPGARRGEALDSVTDRMRRLHPVEHCVQADLALDMHAVLPEIVAREAERAATALWHTSLIAPGSPTLRDYHLQFLERYGTDKGVPVLELLDEARGLGLPKPYRQRTAPTPEPHPEADRRDRLLGELFLDAVRKAAASQVPEVVLDDTTLSALGPAADRQPPGSLELGVEILAESWRDLCSGDFQLVLGANPGSSLAGATFSRFAHVLGQDAAAVRRLAVRDHTDDDTEIAACVAYRPRVARSANVTTLPQWLGHRIPLGVGPAATPGITDIRLEHLTVRADLDRIYLEDVRTGRRVRPVSYSMLHPASGHVPPTARFLLEIGQEGRQWWTPWNWATWSSAPVQPRVTYGRSVLAPAHWLPDRALLEASAAAPEDIWATEVARWRHRWSIPRQVTLTRADNRLAADLDEPLHRLVLQDELCKGPGLVVTEHLTGRGPNRWLTTADGPHAAELVIPLFARRQGRAGTSHGAARTGNTPAPRPRTSDGTHGRAPHPDRTCGTPAAHLPGGEWLYAKLYVPDAFQPQVLSRHLPRLTALVPTPAGGADQWFFLRYADPDPHLRLRFHGKPAALWQELLPALREWAQELRHGGLAGHLILDTYEPESERYGGPAAISRAERVFHADSAAVLAQLATPAEATPTHGDMPLPEPVQGALGVLAVLTRLGSARDVLGWLSHDTFLSRRPDVPRENKNLLAGLLDGDGRPLLPATPLSMLWADRAAALDALHETLATGPVSGPGSRASVAMSLAHMHCNRLHGPQREQEILTHATAREGLALLLARQRHGV